MEDFEDMSNLGKTIKTLRNKQGISQEEFAKGICERTLLSKLENGQRKAPSVVTLGKICQKLSISMDDLFILSFGDKDGALSLIIDDINAYITARNYEEAHRLAGIYLSKTTNSIYRQFYLLEEAIYYLNNKDYKKAEFLAEEGINITTSLTGPLYTLTEIRLVNVFLYLNIAINGYNDRKTVIDAFNNFTHYLSLIKSNNIEVLGYIYLDCCYFYLINLQLNEFLNLYNFCETLFKDLSMHNHLIECWKYKCLYHMILNENEDFNLYLSKLKIFADLLDNKLMKKMEENINYFSSRKEEIKKKLNN